MLRRKFEIKFKNKLNNTQICYYYITIIVQQFLIDFLIFNLTKNISLGNYQIHR